VVEGIAPVRGRAARFEQVDAPRPDLEKDVPVAVDQVVKDDLGPEILAIEIAKSLDVVGNKVNVVKCKVRHGCGSL
jgi:hypothetical protein